MSTQFRRRLKEWMKDNELGLRRKRLVKYTQYGGAFRAGVDVHLAAAGVRLLWPLSQRVVTARGAASSAPPPSLRLPSTRPPAPHTRTRGMMPAGLHRELTRLRRRPPVPPILSEDDGGGAGAECLRKVLHSHYKGRRCARCTFPPPRSGDGMAGAETSVSETPRAVGGDDVHVSLARHGGPQVSISRLPPPPVACASFASTESEVSEVQRRAQLEHIPYGLLDRARERIRSGAAFSSPGTASAWFQSPTVLFLLGDTPRDSIRNSCSRTSSPVRHRDKGVRCAGP
ncbi:hypothetical protein DFH09DRAFT_1327951 [Mycena vulgaris]|nr:hypothetical protein DFH09DRAFT_1327951 [Mycena vulgaris]